MKIQILILLAVGRLVATPLYYTFQGSVTSVSLPDINISVGDPAEYVFLIDHDLDGFYTLDGNTVWPSSPAHDEDPIGDPYYVDLIGGGPYFSQYSDHQYERNYGDYNPDNGRKGISGSIGLSNTFSMLEVFNYSGNSTWMEGENFTGHLLTTGVNSDYREFYLSLTLAKISSSLESEAVPEPSPLFLAGFGLLGLLFRKKRAR
jgi:hypothetical protein